MIWLNYSHSIRDFFLPIHNQRKELIFSHVSSRRGLPVDRCRHKEKGQPLCMEQYYRLFKSYRVPGLQKDSLILNSTKVVQEPEHVIVVCRNQVSIQSK